MDIIAKGTGVNETGGVTNFVVESVEVLDWETGREIIADVAADAGCHVLQRDPHVTNDPEVDGDPDGDVPYVGTLVKATTLPNLDVTNGTFGYFTRRACGSDPVHVRHTRRETTNSDFVILGGNLAKRLEVFATIRQCIEGGEYIVAEHGSCGSCGQGTEEALSDTLYGAYDIDDSTPLNGYTLNLATLKSQIESETKLTNVQLEEM